MLPTTEVEAIPNQSLFVYNLNSKIKLNHLKSLLFELFSAHGRILDIVASKADPQKRSYAFVVFSDVTAATYALHGLHGCEFLGKTISLSYAKSKSYKVAMLDGTFKIRRRKTEAATASNQNIEKSIDKSNEAAQKTPGCTLLVENLPTIMNDIALSILFRQYPGFKEAKILVDRGVGIVEYNNELQANLAMQGLNGFLVAPTNALKISISNENYI